MRRWRILPLLVLLAVFVPVRGNFDDFSLEDALEPTKKPLPTQKPPPSDSEPTKKPLPTRKPWPSDPETIKKPLATRKPPPSDSDDPKPGPPANPRDSDNPRRGSPAHPKDTGNFEDSELIEGDLPKGGGDGSGSNERKGPSSNNVEESEGSQGAIAGIVSAVLATVVGAVSSFIAYQKKKLCFKQSADEENVNMESHRGAQSEPPVQRTLLEN